jgi:hypothetical protein
LDDYNYQHFPPTGEKADKFETFFDAPNVGTIAPDLALEDLESGEPFHLKDFWKSGAVLMEFGSYS